ncbi:MAG: four helix bundle protein [Nitrospirae bacterium]|nr:four helix bundle protein [Nitrospirota bacterium]
MRVESFKDLDAWKLSREIKKKVFDLIKAFPDNDDYSLKDRLIKASISVTSNIAEGFGRHRYQENIQYCRKARGSLNEVIDHLITAYDFGYLDEQNLNEMKNEISKNIRVLNTYISLMERKEKRTNNKYIY